MAISDTFGGKIYEKIHPQRMKQEAEMTKAIAPAGQDRTMAGDKGPQEKKLSTQEEGTSAYPMEDTSKRRKQIDKAIDGEYARPGEKE